MKLRLLLCLVPFAACAATPQADFVLVEKGARRLSLMQDGIVLKVYPIALGFAPKGHKREEGDGRTPEGRYTIDTRNLDSCCLLSLRIDYPNGDDVADAQARGVSPGGDVFIHGQPNEATTTRWGDWTSGCIAVDNPAMVEIWNAVPDGTPIEIRP